MKYLKVIVFLIAAVFGINASAAQFRLMGEMDTGTGGAGNESYIYSYDTFEDLLANNYSSYSATQIDWSSTYSTAGLAYDGAYHLMGEMDTASASTRSDVVIRFWFSWFGRCGSEKEIVTV